MGPLEKIDRPSLLALVGVGILTIFGIGATLLTGSSRPAANSSTPVGAVTTYVLAIQAGDANRAWAVHHPTSDWRDQISLFVTLILVGAPMWITHWRQSPELAERYTLSRRLYLYATLLGSVLAALISGAILVYRLLALVLGTSDVASGTPVIDMGRAMSVILVAAAIGLYHWRVLRSDTGARPAPAPSGIPSPAGIPSDVYAGVQGGGMVVTITGATEQQVRQALSTLPDGAAYTVRR